MSETDAMDLFGEAAPESDTPPAERRPWVVFDTETSGLVDFKKAAEDPSQPRLASLAMIYTTPGLTITRREHIFIRPDGWVMEAEATEHNKLTTEFLLKTGRPVAEALALFEQAIDLGYAFAAHNAQFDAKMMRVELHRAGRGKRFEEVYNVCTMRKATGVCKIPHKPNPVTGIVRKGWKFPSLEEACNHFKIDQHGAHTAMGDAMACLEVLRSLDRIGIDITPEIHKAKKREDN